MPQKTGAPAPPGNACARPLDLSRLRSTAGISLEEIAAGTKISLRFLRAIEAEEFDQLPGGIFNTSYLRQYAAAIGYDEGHLLAYYDLKMNTTASSKGPQRETGSRRFLDRWLGVPAQAQQ
ncbi:MAG TPA: helix-turn-helix domain-containing protein [Bryobacteraceae bacterium]